MQELLPGSWGLQIVASSSRYRWQVLAVALTAISLLITSRFGVRGTDGGDAGGCELWRWRWGRLRRRLRPLPARLPCKIR